jgi:hypothetical protein
MDTREDVRGFLVQVLHDFRSGKLTGREAETLGRLTSCILSTFPPVKAEAPQAEPTPILDMRRVANGDDGDDDPGAAPAETPVPDRGAMAFKGSVPPPRTTGTLALATPRGTLHVGEPPVRKGQGDPAGGE